MPPSTNNGQPPIAAAMQWVTRITTVSLEMSLPAAGGYWLDDRWGTAPWLVVVGATLGFVVGFRHLLQMVDQANRRELAKKKREKR